MKKELSNKEIALFICRMLNPFRTAIFIMFIMAIIWAVDFSLRPYILKIIIDNATSISTQSVFEQALLPSLIYFGIVLIHTTSCRIYGYFIEIKMIPILRSNINNMCFSSLLEQSYSYYQHTFAGSLSNKINDLTSSIPEIVQIVIDRFFCRGLALIIAIFTLWQVNYLFAICIFIWSMIFITGFLLSSIKLANLADIWAEYISVITGNMVDSFSNILSIRLFARNKEEKTTLSCVFDKSVEAERKLQWGYFWMWFFYGYSFVAVQGVSLYFLLKGREAGWITIGDFFVVLSINIAIVDFLWLFAKDFSQFLKLWGKTIQALKSIWIVPNIQDKKNAKPLKIIEGRITFENVEFNFNDKELFKNKSITIEPGQKVGLVGYSGGGKSTFVNLILRLYDVKDGRILIDKQDIRDITQDSLHGLITMIPQDPSLFNRTLMENIRFGNISSKNKEIIEAAKHAYAHDFIMELPEKYESLIGERGVKLSGGQRQRIAIARAILKNSPILILDEATSQLDSITENHIQQSLWRLMEGKTTIVIAHRLSTLLHMDRILVFEQGKIVEDGTHKKLLEQGGLYKTLWETQVGDFLPDRKK